MTPRRLAVGIVHARLATLRELLADLDQVAPVTAHDLASDRIHRHAVERILTHLVEVAAAAATHVVAAVSGQAPSSYRAAFGDLAHLGVIDLDLAESLGRAAGMRNLLVHAYGDIDLELVARACVIVASDLDLFVRSLAAWVAARQ